MPDVTWRLAIFLMVLSSMLLAECLWPRRRQSQLRRQRWPVHAGVQLLNTLLLRVLFPGAAVGVAVLAQQQGWGVLPRLSVSPALALLLSVVLLDLAIYWQHRASHAWPWFWRLHRMHHSDTVVDATTALRFHPLEIILSMVWKSLLIIVLGLPAIAVLVYEIMLNAMALFNHANINLPARLDRVLRLIVVTPDVHRVHHSVYPQETDSNFGNTLSLWDRLFGSWTEQPRDGHQSMQIGLEQFRDRDDARLWRVLTQPWK